MYGNGLEYIALLRLNTDIEFGIRNGMKTLLVLTGICHREDVETKNGTEPDYFCESVADLLPHQE